MRVVIQRVKEAKVSVGGSVAGAIDKGLLIFVAIAKNDGADDIEFLSRKIVELRVFEDDKGKMNLSVQEAGGELLVVSQFTLLGDCEKGRRPSFDAAADPVAAQELYGRFVDALKGKGIKVATGEFRAMMEVSLINDGPVTFILDSGGK